MSKIDVSIIIVSFDTKDLLRTCLASLKEIKKAEIIVVDNGSSDGSADMVKKEFPGVTVVENENNVGFSKANNIGIKNAKGKYLLLLNSDTEVSQETIEKMSTFMEDHPEAGVATCKLVLAGGTLDPACHRGFPTPWAAFTYFAGLEKMFPESRLFASYHQGYKSMDAPHEIDSPSGAFYLVRRKVYETVGPLDEDYFMYAEDLDWSYRIKQAGWKIYYYPKAIALHHKKQSGRDSRDEALRRQTDRYFYQTMKLFYQKHYRHRYGWLVTQLVLFGITLRSMLSR